LAQANTARVNLALPLTFQNPSRFLFLAMTCGKVAHAAQSQSRAWQGTGQSNSPADNSYVLGELGQSIIRLVCSGQLAEADKVLDAAAAKERIPKALYHSLASACQKKLNQPWVALWFLARMERAGYKANIVTFNCTIGAFMRAGDLPEATKWWNSMIDAGLKPNRITYNIMISGCGKICDAASAESWMLRMIADGIQPCTVSYSAVIDAFSRLGDVDSAEKWFFEVIAARVTANFAVYHSMISACAKAGNIEKAERWLAGMLRAGIMPDDRIFNSVINACAPTGDFERAEHWYGQMLMAGFSADAVTFNSILNTCCKAGRADRAMFFFQEMVAHGFPASISCYNCLIKACAQQGDAKSALHWFRKLTAQGLVPNLLTYSGMIETFTECGRTDIAAQWLDRMVAQGIQPDSLTSYLMKPEIVNNMRASRVHFNLPEGADKDEQKWNISTQDSLHSLPPGLEEEVQHSQRTAQIASRSLSDTDSSTPSIAISRTPTDEEVSSDNNLSTDFQTLWGTALPGVMVNVTDDKVSFLL